MALPWLRLYAEFASDPKIQILAFEDQRHFVMLLCLKCSGVLDANAPSEAYRERLVAKALGLDGAAAAEAKRRLIEGGLITSDWQPTKWDSRQFSSDSSSERVRKFRELRKRNVTETLPKRRSNAIDTDTDTDTEQKRQKTVAVAPGLDLDVWNRWVAYRKESGKALKPASYPAAQRKLASFGTQQANVVEESIANGYQGLFAPKSPAKRVSQWE
jgi:hypothetical protein